MLVHKWEMNCGDVTSWVCDVTHEGSFLRGPLLSFDLCVAAGHLRTSKHHGKVHVPKQEPDRVREQRNKNMCRAENIAKDARADLAVKQILQRQQL